MSESPQPLFDAHGSAYIADRAARWKLETTHAPALEATLAAAIAKIFELPTSSVEIHRFDKYWFEAHDPQSCEWVKGCPDYFAIIFGSKIRYIYIELKIKNVEFQKTVSTAPRRTQAGSWTPPYGCPSYYLDIDPVFRNMNAFCKNSGILPIQLQVLFAKPDATADEMRLISLDAINNLILHGWNGIMIRPYGEDYGKETYLIPKDATKPLLSLTREDFLMSASDVLAVPGISTLELGLRIPCGKFAGKSVSEVPVESLELILQWLKASRGPYVPELIMAIAERIARK